MSNRRIWIGSRREFISMRPVKRSVKQIEFISQSRDVIFKAKSPVKMYRFLTQFKTAGFPFLCFFRFNPRLYLRFEVSITHEIDQWIGKISLPGMQLGFGFRNKIDFQIRFPAFSPQASLLDVCNWCVCNVILKSIYIIYGNRVKWSEKNRGKNSNL